VFADLLVDGLVQGGQTMNPSIDTLTKTIRKVNARNVFVLPNNSNIILAARQAAEIVDCNVVVIPTKTIPQGISAAMAYNPDVSLEENTRRMTEAFQNVQSGSVTYAVRDTSFNGTDIKKGDIIGLQDGKIVTVSQAVEETSIKLLETMLNNCGEDDAIVTIFYGEGMDEGNANALVEQLQGNWPDVEFIVESGGQPLYYYYFSVE